MKNLIINKAGFTLKDTTYDTFQYILKKTLEHDDNNGILSIGYDSSNLQPDPLRELALIGLIYVDKKNNSLGLTEIGKYFYFNGMNRD